MQEQGTVPTLFSARDGPDLSPRCVTQRTPGPHDSYQQACSAAGRRIAPTWRPLPARAGGWHSPQT